MIVVCDSSPLIALLSVDKIDLLEQLFGMVIIPPAVCEEVFGSPAGKQAVLPEFIRVESPAAETPVRFLKMNLHSGESEAIALALDRGCDAIVLDDKLARETAERLGLRVVGTLGVLILAKQKGVLSEIRPLVIQMMERISFRLSPTVLNKALSLLNEPLF